MDLTFWLTLVVLVLVEFLVYDYREETLLTYRQGIRQVNLSWLASIGLFLLSLLICLSVALIVLLLLHIPFQRTSGGLLIFGMAMWMLGFRLKPPPMAFLHSPRTFVEDLWLVWFCSEVLLRWPVILLAAVLGNDQPWALVIGLSVVLCLSFLRLFTLPAHWQLTRRLSWLFPLLAVGLAVLAAVQIERDTFLSWLAPLPTATVTLPLLGAVRQFDLIFTLVAIGLVLFIGWGLWFSENRKVEMERFFDSYFFNGCAQVFRVLAVINAIVFLVIGFFVLLLKEHPDIDIVLRIIFAICLATFILLACLYSVYRLWHRWSRISFILPLVLVLLLGLWIRAELTFTQSGWIGYTATSIVQRQFSPTQQSFIAVNDLSIYTSDTVHFQNMTNQPLMLCLGSNGRCNPNSAGPGAFKGDGLFIKPGQTVDVQFNDTGNFMVTCPTLHNGDLEISVEEEDTSGGD